MTVWVDDPAALVAEVEDGCSLAVGGFHFTRVPIAQIRALIRRGARDLHYVAWGGGLPLELLLGAGAIRRAQLTFSSFDLFGLAPRFRRAVEQRELELDEWTALGLIKGLEAAGEQLPYEVLQAPLGADLADGFSRIAPELFGAVADSVVAVPAVHLDVLLLHAQRADEAGNVELTGPRGLDLASIFAARSVLVTVEERVPAADLGDRPGAFVLPRTFVSRVAVASGGAYPTSCLPYYVADYERLQQIAEADSAIPVPDDLLEPELDEAAELAALEPAAIRSRLRSGPVYAEGEPYSVDELMAVWIARTLDDESVCSVGSASPLPTAGYLLAKELWAPNLVVLSFNGGLVDIAPRPLALLCAEALDYASAVAHAGGDETYHWYYQRGLITHEIVGAAQIDERGATNNAQVSRPDGSMIRLPGQGGMADVANLHATFVLYVPRHSPRTFVERVELVSAQRMVPGRVAVITNLGVFERASGEETLRLTQLHPGITVDRVHEQTGFRVRVADDLVETAPPSERELDVLRRRVDPLGVRRLDFVPAAERGDLIRELLAAERRSVAGAVATR